MGAFKRFNNDLGKFNFRPVFYDENEKFPDSIKDPLFNYPYQDQKTLMNQIEIDTSTTNSLTEEEYF